MNDQRIPPKSGADVADPKAADPTQTLVAIGPIARSSVVDAVADRLRGEILAGRIPAGSRLPSERELSLALGINRLTLRAALSRLEALGLISTRHGAGTVVASWRERAGLDALTTLLSSLRQGEPMWHELVRSTLEVRRVLASEAIALAAERHTDEDLGVIAECARVLAEHVHDPMAFARADLAFMRAVVRAARNVGLELLLNTFARFPDEQPALVAALYDDCAGSVALYGAVIQIIQSRDAVAARELSRRALDAHDAAWAERHPSAGAVEPAVAPIPSSVIAPKPKGQRRKKR